MEYPIKRIFSLETDIAFLLEDFHISSVKGIVLAMVFALVVAIAFHTLNFLIHFRERHFLKRKCDWFYYVSSFYHMVSVFLAYVMVSCVMTYNIWLFVSILLGSGIGQLLLGPFFSLRLEKKYAPIRSEENELLTDLLPENHDQPNDDNDDNDDNVEMSYHPSVNDSFDSVLNPGSMDIELEDLIKHRPSDRNVTRVKNIPASAQNEDEDKISEYDSLNDDLKLILD